MSTAKTLLAASLIVAAATTSALACNSDFEDKAEMFAVHRHSPQSAAGSGNRHDTAARNSTAVLRGTQARAQQSGVAGSSR